MGNDFLYMFMMFNFMNSKERPIPMETMMGSMDMVPAPMRFMVNATAIQNCEADCLAEDDNLRADVAKLMDDKKITFDYVAKHNPRVASLVKPVFVAKAETALAKTSSP